MHFLSVLRSSTLFHKSINQSTNKSVFSLILSSQHDCQHWLLSAVQQICCWALVPAIDQYLLSTGRSAANPLAACCCRSMGPTAWGQMDIQTDAQALRNRAPDTMQAMSINLAMGKRNPTYRCGMPAAGFNQKSIKSGENFLCWCHCCKFYSVLQLHWFTN